MPTVRNPDNVNIWIDANVYISTVTPVIPATIDAAMGATWSLVGILDGNAGFDDDRKWKENLNFGWGIGLIKVSHSQFEMNRTFTAMEDNPVTQSILNPGSTDTLRKVPLPAYVYVAFESVADTGKVERLITRRKAQVWAEKVKRSEADVSSFVFACKIFADSAQVLFDRQVTAATP